MYSFEESLHRIYGKTLGAPEICIAVLDTDADLACSTLKNASIERVALPGVKITAEKTHGTHVANIIFSSGAGEAMGIAPNCRGMYIPIYNDGPSGLSCTQERLADALLLAAARGAHIINISGGMLTPSDSSSLRLQQAVDYCHEKRIQIVAAVGNEGCDCLHVPASLKNVLAVGAVNNLGQPYRFNNYGWVYQKQGLLVPLRDMQVIAADGLPVKKEASSYAAPVLSGILGLLCSVQIMNNISPDPARIKEILLETSDKCPLEDVQECKRYLAGIINLEAAFQAVLQEVPLSTADRTQVSLSPSGMSCPAGRIQEDSFYPVAAGAVLFGNLRERKGIMPSSEPQQVNSLVYALGEIGYDIPSDTVKESLVSETGSLRPEHFLKVLGGRFQDNETEAFEADPSDPNRHTKRLYYAQDVVWTLNLDGVAIYAIRPEGAFADAVYASLRDFMVYQIEVARKYGASGLGHLVRAAIAGSIHGTMRLGNGAEVPVIVPELRGMYVWTMDRFIEDFPGTVAAVDPVITAFWERIFFALRNTGITPDERAINFSATHAFQMAQVFKKVYREGLSFFSIHAERSSFCRADRDCRDVVLVFFNPVRQMEEAKTIYRFTVDVSSVVPALTGPVRSWKE